MSAFVKEKSKIVQETQTQQSQEDELMMSSMYSALSEESDLDTTNSSYAGSCCSGAVGGPMRPQSASANSTSGTSGGSWFSHLFTLDDLVQVSFLIFLTSTFHF